MATQVRKRESAQLGESQLDRDGSFGAALSYSMRSEGLRRRRGTDVFILLTDLNGAFCALSLSVVLRLYVCVSVGSLLDRALKPSEKWPKKRAEMRKFN